MALFGCKPANQLVGSWKIGGVKGLGSASVTMQFNNDGTFEAKVNSDKGSVDQKGNYTTDGKTVTMTTTDYNMSSTDPAIQSQLDALNKQSQTALKNAKPSTVPLIWKSNNEFSMAGVSTGAMSASSMGTFTRQ